MNTSNKNQNIILPKGKLGILLQYWIYLAVFSLALGGLFSLAPVILRGPFFKEILPIEHIFAVSLVIHVDLTVLVWMFSIGGIFWTLIASKEHYEILKVTFVAAVIGTILITISPFIGEAMPLKNNYIPVLQNPVFFLGLGLFGCAIMFQCMICLLDFKQIKKNNLNLAIASTSVTTLIAFLCFFISHSKLGSFYDIGALSFYESLFWAGGHVYQFTFITLTIICWLWLSKTVDLESNSLCFILLLNMIFVIPAPIVLLLSNDLTDTTNFFAMHMRYLGGITAFLVAIKIFLPLLRKKNQDHHIKAALVFSIILFGLGGIFGFMISGTNVTIPAHYHGSIVGISLAFMALIYYLVPALKMGRINNKIAKFQPYLYGIGQIMHISGLAWMGGYGALRKDAGSSASIDTIFGKVLFFSGGLLAITGGLIFVMIVILGFIRQTRK